MKKSHFQHVHVRVTFYKKGNSDEVSVVRLLDQRVIVTYLCINQLVCKKKQQKKPQELEVVSHEFTLMN